MTKLTADTPITMENMNDIGRLIQQQVDAAMAHVGPIAARTGIELTDENLAVMERDLKTAYGDALDEIFAAEKKHLDEVYKTPRKTTGVTHAIDVGTPGHVDWPKKKCKTCGWYELGCVCGDEDITVNPPKLNRAQRRALRHKR